MQDELSAREVNDIESETVKLFEQSESSESSEKSEMLDMDKELRKIAHDQQIIPTNETPEIDYEKYLKDFKFPEHNPKCKKCFGRMYIGYKYDPKNIQIDESGKRIPGKKVPCPKYEAEVYNALRVHTIKTMAKEKNAIKEIPEIKLKPEGFNDMISSGVVK